MTRWLDGLVQLGGPVLLVVAVGLVSTTVSAANQVYFLNALVAVAIVVAIYVFVGNSGVLSFGQISFVAVGAFAAGVMTVPLDSKKGVLTTLFPVLRDHTIGNVPSLLLAAALGGLFAFVVGGMTRLVSATLGGFLIGYVSGVLGGALPSQQSQYLPSLVFGLVILVLLVRPDGLFTRGRGLVERV